MSAEILLNGAMFPTLAWRPPPGLWIASMGDVTVDIRRGETVVLRMLVPRGWLYEVGATTRPFDGEPS